MAPGKWDDEEESTPPSSPPQIARRQKFDDEEEDDSDVVNAWDEAEDSEVEREKAKKAAEVKAKADAEAAANKKSKAQRIEERRMENMRKKMDDDDTSDDEDEAERRERLRRTEQDADLKHAEDLFAGIGINKKAANKAVISVDPSDPSKTVDLSSLPIFKPKTKEQFTQLREVLGPIMGSLQSNAQYTIFMQEFSKQILKDLPSEQIKKIASGLTTLSNEKMKEEKAADKGGKKSKAKAKAALNANRDVSSRADTTSYDDLPLDDGDFM